MSGNKKADRDSDYRHQDYESVKTYLEESNGHQVISAELTMIPKTTVPVNDAATVARVLYLMDALEENDDVQNVYANFDIPDEVLNSIE